MILALLMSLFLGQYPSNTDKYTMQAHYDEVEVLAKTYQKATESEQKVDNIRRRIALMKERIGYKDAPISEKPMQVKQAPDRKIQQHNNEMAKLRALMQPKAKEETEIEKTDRELAEAIEKAMAKTK